MNNFNQDLIERAFENLNNLSNYYTKEDIDAIFQHCKFLNNSPNDLFNKSLQIIRNSIYFHLFPRSNVPQLLEVLSLCFKIGQFDGDIAQQLSVQIIHNLLSWEIELEEEKSILIDILMKLPQIVTKSNCSPRFQSIIWHLLDRLSKSIFNYLFICSILTPESIESIFEIEDDFAEKGELFLSSMCLNSNFLAVHFNYLQNNNTKFNILRFIEDNIDISVENINFLLSLSIDIMKPKLFLKSISNIEIDIWKKILICLNKIENLNQIIDFNDCKRFIEAAVNVLVELRLVDGDKNEEIRYKSQYSPCKNKEDLKERPIFNVKYLLINILSLLANEKRGVQDFIAEIGGVELIMCNTRIDLCNPLLHQSAIYAIRNICLNNEGICERIKQFTVSDTDDEQLLDILNLKAVKRDGMTVYAPRR